MMLSALPFSLVTISSAAAPQKKQPPGNQMGLSHSSIMQSTRRVDGSSNIIDGTYSLHFERCFSMATEPTDPQLLMLENSDLAPYTARGQIRSQTSVVEFRACDEGGFHCSSHVLDLDTYLHSVMNQPTDDLIRYCQACQESIDFCFLDGNRERRHRRGLGDWQGYVPSYDAFPPVEYIDCVECEAKQCFDNHNNDVQADKVIVKWMEDLMACQPLTGIQWLGKYDLYTSFMCNADGSGVEVALFLDQHCSMYTSSVAFGNLTLLKDSLDVELFDTVLAPFQTSSRLVTNAFRQTIECADVSYQNPVDSVLPMDILDVTHDLWAVNSYCQALLSSSANLDTCRVNHLPVSSSSGDNDYLLTIQQADDIASICSVVHTKGNHYDSHLWHVYKETDDYGAGSGHWYTYGHVKDKGLSDNGTSSKTWISYALLEVMGAIIVVIVMLASCVHAIRGEKS
eukprot:CAMPEP_0198145886 /NCGR_PEP_ID=MMETSP1443-20131203/25960_1 /TAXON_ID=186043 /ORGANISM="Entomoneis sp., Strain CCMP2396" /LENGTH=454 /DNA_ID=CAMNT_0043809647 /DNA_START=9 /DNA_END=1369 /DNA_ORIENTATION=+